MEPNVIFDTAWKAAEDAIQKEIETNGPENPYAFDCGFGWVVVKPARGEFIKYCKEQAKLSGRYGSKHYADGWNFWNPGGFNGQSIRMKEAGAIAFSASLRENGIEASWGSRLD